MTQLIIIILYLILLLALGVVASRMFRGTSEDYMLASHSIGPFLLLMSLFGTTMTAFALVGSTGEAFKEGVGVYGQLASSSGIIHSLCFFLIGVKLWGFGRKYGYRTQIQYFRDRLDADHFGLLLFPILVGLVIPYLLIGVISSGTVINSVTEGAFTSSYFANYDYGVPMWLGSLAICVVVLLYVFSGGMRGTAWANAFQTMIFMVLGIVTFIFIADRLGGEQAASQAVLEKHPTKLMRTVAPEEEISYEHAMAAWEGLAQYNWAVENRGLQLTPEQLQEARDAFPARMPGWEGRAEADYALNQGMFELTPEERQQALIAQDDRVIPTGTLVLDAAGNPLPLSAFPRSEDWARNALQAYEARIGHPDELLDPEDPSAGTKWTRKRALGMYRATRWAPEEVHTLGKLTFFTYLLVPLSVGMFPHLFQHWLTARSAGSFKLAVVLHPIFIMIVWVPCVLVGVWATSATLDGRSLIPPHFPANAVLAKMVADLSGPVLGGLLTAGILAAIMSSLDSQFLAIGTMFTNDMVLHYSPQNEFSERKKVLIARSFIVGIVAITYAFSLFEPRRVFTLGVWCFSGFSALFPLVFASVYWRRLSVAGAYASVVAAVASWVYFFYQSKFGAVPDYTFDLTIAGEKYSMMPVAPIFAASTAALILVSLVTRPPSERTLAKFFD
ncbi:MAG: sodium:solute symporter family protein [Pirellulales bacterium]